MYNPLKRVIFLLISIMINMNLIWNYLIMVIMLIFKKLIHI